MRKDIAEKWVVELRSGNREQTKGALGVPGATATAYCCLGVLCEVVVDEGAPIKREIDHGEVSFNGRTGMPPVEVADYVEAEFERFIGSYWLVPVSNQLLELMKTRDLSHVVLDDEFGKRWADLSVLNDSGKFSFSDIADIIEDVHVKGNK